MKQLGELLRTAREEQGKSLDDVERATHIRRHLLQALESDDFKKFPSSVIARGLIRNYAKYLSLDPIEALTLYDGNGIMTVKGQRLTPDGIEFMNLSMAPRPLVSWDVIVGGLLVFLFLGGAGYLGYTALFQIELFSATTSSPPLESNLPESSALLLPTITPLPTNTPTPLPPTSTPTPMIYDGVTVELLLKETSWVQILVDGTRTFEGELKPGDNPRWTGKQRVAVRAGNAGGVEVVVNGINRGTMGAAGQVVDQIWEKVEGPTALSPDAEATAQPNATITRSATSDETDLERYREFLPTPTLASPPEGGEAVRPSEFARTEAAPAPETDPASTPSNVEANSADQSFKLR